VARSPCLASHEPVNHSNHHPTLTYWRRTSTNSLYTGCVRSLLSFLLLLERDMKGNSETLCSSGSGAPVACAVRKATSNSGRQSRHSSAAKPFWISTGNHVAAPPRHRQQGNQAEQREREKKRPCDWRGRAHEHKIIDASMRLCHRSQSRRTTGEQGRCAGGQTVLTLQSFLRFRLPHASRGLLAPSLVPACPGWSESAGQNRGVLGNVWNAEIRDLSAQVLSRF